MAEMNEVEALLRSALVPVEPSEALSDRLQTTLSEITDLAVDELADWELSTMTDPRNWVPTAAAVVAGSAAAAGLVVLSARRQRRRSRSGDPLHALEHGLREVSSDLRSRLGR